MKQFLRIVYAQLLTIITFSAFSQAPLQWSTPGTYQWVCPVGVNGVKVQLWGAGGGSNNSYNYSGGGGAYTQSTVIPVTPGATYVVVVGDGKTNVNSDWSLSNSTFGVAGNAYVLANGGRDNGDGGTASSGGYVATSYAGGKGPYCWNNGTYANSGGAASASPCGKGEDGHWAGDNGLGRCGGGFGGAGGSNGNFPGGGAGGGNNSNYYGGDGTVILTPVETSISYDSAGTYNWVCPVGVSSVNLQMWGGGGSGTGNSGGGGAFVQTGDIPVQPGQTYQVVVGTYYTNYAVPLPSNSTFGIAGNIYVTANGAGFNIFGIGTQVPGPASYGNYVNFSYGGGFGVYSNNGSTITPSGGGAAGSPCGTGAQGNWAGAPGTGVCGGGSGGNGQSVPPSEGKFPGGGGGSGYGFAKGACGRIILNYVCDAGSTGSIGNGHTVPGFTPELIPDSVTNIISATGVPGMTIGWQQSTDNVNFSAAKNSTNTTGYRFDKDSLGQTTYYRRGNNACVSGFGNWSNTVQITAFTYNNGNGGKNGTISGTVYALDGSPINQRWVYAKSLTPLKGRQVGYLDSVQTSPDGKFEIDSVFYGDHDNTAANPVDSVKCHFLVYYDTSNHHKYQPVEAYLGKKPGNTYSGINLVDSSVFGVSGQVYQVCKGCLDKKGNAANINGPVDSVFIRAKAQNHNSSDSSKTGYRTAQASFGNYSLSLKFTDQYRITPTYLNHGFKPADTLINITGSLSNLNFIDTSTHLITGTFSAGCGDVIGSATLEFDDTLHRDADSNIQKSVFKKQVTTDSKGKYSVRLPARAYKVRIVKATIKDKADPSTTEASVISYFNALAKDTSFIDSVYRDISMHDTVLNLVYHRAPQIAVVGLRDDSARVNTCSAFSNYDFWPQGIRRPVYFKVYQGPASKGCLTDTGTVFVKTDISINQGFYNYDTLPVIHGIGIDSIVAAMPNTLKDFHTGTYSKTITAKYTDILGRSFSTDTVKPALPVIVVTGASIDPSGTNFVTVSPQIPMLILHDPPGNRSSAAWEQETSSSKTVGFAAKTTETLGTYLKAHVGISELIGMFVVTKVEAELGIDAEFNTTQTYTSTNETEITTKAIEKLETSDDPAYIGKDADVVKGQALNIAYREGQEVDWDSAACKILDPKPVVVTDVVGIGTTYTYTIGSIRDEEIPRLEKLAVATANPDSANYYRNQEGVWQQLIDNNEANIKSAPVIENRSFSNGTISGLSTTLTNDQKNTYKFDLDIEQKLAIDVGFDIAGNGLTEGARVGWSVTIGGDSTITKSTSTTTGYTFSDDNAGLKSSQANYSGDYLSVNIKRDPVYGTPMFETYAGGTQCPHEEGTVSLYHPLITPISITEKKNITGNTTQFTFYANNLSLDPTPNGSRTYVLFLNGNSNGDAATVNLNSNNALNPYFVTIPNNGGQQLITVDVTRNPNGGVYNYDNLEIIMTDPCFNTTFPLNFYINPHEYSTIKLSADFTSPVSPVILESPANNWVSNKSNNDSIKIVFDGYNTSNLANVAVQYNVPGSNNWITISTIGKNKLGATSTTYYWRTSKISDGTYNLRLQVTDNANNKIYSNVAQGIIDRVVPQLFGTPKPSSGSYVAGSEISYSYNENINTVLKAGSVKLTDITLSSAVSAQSSAFGNTIIIVPAINILGNTGHKYQVIVNNVSDLNGNVKTTPDTSYFTVGTTIFATGSNGLNISTTPGSIYEDSKGSLAVKFTRNSKVLDTAIIYYTISGNAVMNKDYTVTYNKGQDTNSVTGINGGNGQIRLPKDSSAVTMYIHPINDSIAAPDKILNIILAPGGEYAIGSNYSVADTILNHNILKPVITANKSTMLCSGDSVTLSTTATINGKPATLLWSTGAKTTSITVKTSGSYTVKATDNKGFTGYSDPTIVTFTCGIPANLKVNVLSNSSAVLKWGVANCAVKYAVQYRQVGKPNWITDTITGLTDTLKVLKANTSYQWQVASICQYPAIIIGSYAAGADFTTPVSLTEIAVTNTDDYKVATAGDGFSATVYPNPALSTATLNVKGTKGPYTVIVENLQGVVLWKAENVTDSNVKLPLTNFAAGIYMVTVKDQLHTGTLKLMKQ